MHQYSHKYCFRENLVFVQFSFQIQEVALYSIFSIFETFINKKIYGFS